MKRTGNLIALVAAAGLTLTACGGADDTATETETSTSTTSSSSTPTPSETSETTEAAMAGPVGPGCAAYAEANASGPASVSGMAMDPVATAAGNNPLLTTLTAAVSGGLNPDVNLVNDLNGGELTVFAPVDDAFAAIDPAVIESLQTDSATLTSILTYHVLPERLEPDEIDGTHTTLQGSELTVSGDAEMLTVNDTTAVICGGVQTANATVYLVDSVLMPAM